MKQKIDPTNGDPEIQARKAEIAATRARLTDEVSEIKERVSPENMAEAAKDVARDMAHEAKDAAKEGVKNAAQAAKDGVVRAAHATKETVQDAAIQARHGAEHFADEAQDTWRRTHFDLGSAVRASPVPVALTALGLGYLVYRSFSIDDPSVSRGPRLPYGPAQHARGATGDRSGSPMYDSSLQHDPSQTSMHDSTMRKEQLSGPTMGERLGSRAHDVGTSVQESAHDLSERAHDASRAVRRQGQRAKSGSVRLFDAQPLVVGLGAFVAGLAIGAMIPGTERENELMGDQRDELVQRAKARAKEAGQAAREVAENGAEELEARLDEQMPTTHA